MFRIYKLVDIRNRAYVIDSKGNKLFYGTMYQCSKFIEYMLKGSDEYDKGKEGYTVTGRENRY